MDFDSKNVSLQNMNCYNQFFVPESNFTLATILRW